MTKYMIGLILGSLVSSSLMADFIRVEAGAGAWLNNTVGEKTYTVGGANGEDIASEDDETSPYVWALVKHPVPMLPNLRLEYVDISTKGIANGSFEDFSASNSPTQLDITQYDIIPYYNLLDNTVWITLDVGVDFKFMEINYKAYEEITDISLHNETNSIILPLLYTRIRTEIPATNIGLEADAKFISYNSSTVYDARVKLDYTLDFMPIVQPAIEVGYRIQKYDLDDADVDGKLDLEFSGVYAGIMLRF